MQERTVVTDSGNSVAMIGLVAVVIIAALVALFVWRPWTVANSPAQNSTTIVNPAGPGAAAGSSSGTTGSGSGTSGSSSTTTTHK